MKPQDFADRTPRFLMEEYFDARLKAQGVFYDRFGKIRREFTLDLRGERTSEDTLLLHEHLVYDTGEVLDRTYTITKLDEHHYQATADGLVGPAKIESYGNALRWKYRLKQMIDGSEWTLSFNDWMFLQDDGVVLNRAYASKFGFRIGEVFMLVRKLDKE